jgi:GGDEF domain-containing protein
MAEDSGEGPSRQDWDVAHSVNKTLPKIQKKGWSQELQDLVIRDAEETWKAGKREGELLDAKTGLHLVEQANTDSVSFIKDLIRLPKDRLEEVIWTVLLVDGNSFKRINDQLDHAEGDENIKNLANSLKQSVRDTDRVYRNSGKSDEFIVLVRRVPGESGKGTQPLGDSVEYSIIPRIITSHQEALDKFFSKGEKSETRRKLKKEGVGTLAIGGQEYTGTQLLQLFKEWEAGSQEQGFFTDKLFKESDAAQAWAKEPSDQTDVKRHTAILSNPDRDFRIVRLPSTGEQQT